LLSVTGHNKVCFVLFASITAGFGKSVRGSNDATLEPIAFSYIAAITYKVQIELGRLSKTSKASTTAATLCFGGQAYYVWN
jgi:hypothetical protein